ncbi:malonate decarboxylase holo-[acyl-carrier-protein] synthase [Enterococcus sp. JM4C]|uniref:malonate decarboxylase holo-ACP synthase n=1 Tax=Candidatus Enterococcus huntleyi TaxID=1857217 RepID=UPI00137973FD|nr:malonate decarboxylase holo-ACP synthase [Enterococcus sp. JM4C]KAF1297812.1 malonate decarboxylase holo-[acyl-carrier-protein] synthase [Enterococcus sp. JM4C]
MDAHDIVQFQKTEALQVDWPDWFCETDPLYATVRRGTATQNKLPVGLRGKERSQRFAFELPQEAVTAVIHPWQLTEKESFRKTEIAQYPVYLAFQQAKKILKGSKWGVGGSLGFELATGFPTVKETSDFDLLIYTKELADLPLTVIQQNLEYFHQVDTQIITEKGGFALKEYLRNHGKKLLLKTITGPVLTDELW